MGDRGQHTPADTNEHKSKVLHATFFPSGSQAIQIPEEVDYLSATFDLPRITSAQVSEAILGLKLYKAPGPDRIPNKVYLHCSDLIHIPLLEIF